MIEVENIMYLKRIEIERLVGVGETTHTAHNAEDVVVDSVDV